MVYEYLGAELGSISQADRWETDKDESIPYASILLVNKQIYGEAKGPFWKQVEWTCSLETLFFWDDTFIRAEFVTPGFSITYEALPTREASDPHPDALRLAKTPMVAAGTVNILVRDISVSDMDKWKIHISRVLEPIVIPGLRQNEALAKVNLMMVANLGFPLDEASQTLAKVSVQVAKLFQQALPNVEIKCCMPNFDFLDI